MSIYSRVNYRKIYEDNFGPIPTDENGRTYEIHHIDGDHNNNSLINLQLVSIEEHYNIHLTQKDYGACSAIMLRMNLTPDEISSKVRELQKKRISDGTHNFLGDNNPVYRKIKEGTHHLLRKEDGSSLSSDRVKKGTHNFLGDTNPVYKMREQGIHPFQDPNFQKNRVLNGTHNFLGENSPTQLLWSCPHCNRSGKGKSNYVRYHGDNCKNR